MNSSKLASLVLFLAAIATNVATCHAQSPVGVATQFTHSANDDAFPSPDGKQIVYDSVVEGKSQIFIMRTDGTGQRQVTHDPSNHESPAWSPDGAKIAYVSDRNGHSVIYMMNADGSGDERLTSENGESIHPNWAVDSKSVIFCSDDDLHPPIKNDSQVLSVDIKTKKVDVLITGGTNTYASWSPDGKKIVFRRMLGQKNSEVFVKDGEKEINLTNSPAFDGWPAWSPDGKRIAFASNRVSNYRIYVMNADGSNVQQVANTEGRGTVPRWSTDGGKIFFTICKKADSGFDCQIYVAPTPTI